MIYINKKSQFEYVLYRPLYKFKLERKEIKTTVRTPQQTRAAEKKTVKNYPLQLLVVVVGSETVRRSHCPITVPTVGRRRSGQFSHLRRILQTKLIGYRSVTNTLCVSSSVVQPFRLFYHKKMIRDNVTIDILTIIVFVYNFKYF